VLVHLPDQPVLVVRSGLAVRTDQVHLAGLAGLAVLEPKWMVQKAPESEQSAAAE